MAPSSSSETLTLGKEAASVRANDETAAQAPAVPASTCAFSLIGDRASFDALGPEWNDLFERAASPHQVFQGFDWLWHWANHYLGKGETPAIVIGRCDGRLVLIWPLVSTRILGLRVLTSMGEPVSQYGDAFVEERPDKDELLAKAFDFAATLPADLIWLRRVRDDAATAPILRRKARPSGGAARAPFVDFGHAKDVAAFEKRYSPKLRSDRRRHLRRLADIGEVTFERHRPGPEARALARLALAFKRDWARQTGRVAPNLLDARFENFFADAASGGKHSPDLNFSVLFCAGEPIGVEISVACKDRVFGHVLAAKPGFGKQGAGAILAGYSIASALERGFRAFDLLAPADPYKMEWAGGCVGVRDFAFARSVAGRLFQWLWLDHGRDAAKALARRLSPRLGRMVLRRP